MMYCSSLFLLPPFTPSCIPPTPPKKINWWEGLRWASVVFGSCYLRTLPTQFVLLPAKTLPGLLQQNKRSSHASSCPWPTARCKMFIAHKWGHCPLHCIFYLAFPLKLSKTTFSRLLLGSTHTESVLLIALGYPGDTLVLASAGRRWGERRKERKTMGVKGSQH